MRQLTGLDASFLYLETANAAVWFWVAKMLAEV